MNSIAWRKAVQNMANILIDYCPMSVSKLKKKKTWTNTDRASSKEAVFLTSLFLFLGICTWFAILPHFNCRISRIIVKHKWLLMPKGDCLHKQLHGAHTQPCISWYFQLLFWIVPHLRVPPHFRIQSHYLHCSKLFTGLSSWHRR